MYMIFVSSINENHKLANVIKEQLEEEGKDSEIINLVELDIPLYDTNREKDIGMPPILDSIMKKMKESDGYIFVSPEYNYSTPPVLANFIAWISTIGDDFRAVFSLKFIQLATHSGGGGNDVMNVMRTQFTKLGSVVVPREIITTYQKPLNKDSSQRILKQFIDLSS